MKILLIGAGGQLGTDLSKVLNDFKLVPTTKKDLDITDFKRTSNTIIDYHPDIIINTAAYHKVEECENNVSSAILVNSLSVWNLALICKKIDSVLFHFSTDYVFDGNKNTPYKETDTPNPINAYGISKLAGEYFIKYILRKYFIIRTSGLFGRAGSKQKAGNFVDVMLAKGKNKEEIKVVDDTFFSPTYTLDLANKIREIIILNTSVKNKNLHGIYHITNSGYCSWYEFAKKIFEFAKIQSNVKPIKYEMLSAKVLRPKYSVLRNYNLRKIGIKPSRSWDVALKSYLNE